MTKTRVVLIRSELDKLFLLLAREGLSTKDISGKVGRSERTIRDWKRAKFTIPIEAYELMKGLAGADSKKFNPSFMLVSEQKRAAGSSGGNARKIKGPIGTRADRVKGGHMSYAARANNPEDIFAKKVIKKPGLNCDLAEFVGIMIGDGGISRYQATISLNSIDDSEYILYVAALGKGLFNIEPTISHHPKKNYTTIVFSSIELTSLLLGYGLPVGDKIRGGLTVPGWIIKDPRLSLACARGIFDTDGCIYNEVHHRKSGTYSYPRCSIVSASKNLRADLLTIFTRAGLHAKERQKRCVTIEQFTDIEKYFRIIGSNNPKHCRRYTLFGGVA